MSVLQTIPLGTMTLHVCSAVPTHSASAGDLAINKAGGVDTFLYECTGGTTWTANATGGGGGGAGVSSFNARTGVVVPVAADYAEYQITHSTVAKSANYTLTATDWMVMGSASGGAIVLTLPAVAASTNRAYRIKKSDSSANTVTVQGNAAELIDGANTAVLTRQYESIDLVCDGTSWSIG